MTAGSSSVNRSSSLTVEWCRRSRCAISLPLPTVPPRSHQRDRCQVSAQGLQGWPQPPPRPCDGRVGGDVRSLVLRPSKGWTHSPSPPFRQFGGAPNAAAALRSSKASTGACQNSARRSAVLAMCDIRARLGMAAFLRVHLECRHRGSPRTWRTGSSKRFSELQKSNLRSGAVIVRSEQLERFAQLLVEGQQAARVAGHQFFGRLDDGLAGGLGDWAVADLVFAGGLGQQM